MYTDKSKVYSESTTYWHANYCTARCKTTFTFLSAGRQLSTFFIHCTVFYLL